MRSTLSVLSMSMLIALTLLTRPSTSAEHETLIQIQTFQDQLVDAMRRMNLEFSAPLLGESSRRIARDISKEKRIELLEAVMQERFDQLKMDFDNYEKMIDCSQAMEVPPEHKQEFYGILDSQADANRKSMTYLKNLPGVDDDFRASIDQLVERHDQYIKFIEKCVPRP